MVPTDGLSFKTSVTPANRSRVFLSKTIPFILTVEAFLETSFLNIRIELFSILYPIVAGSNFSKTSVISAFSVSILIFVSTLSTCEL